MLGIYFIGSIQLVFMGIIGEYVFRIYKESQGRPIYFVKKLLFGRKFQSATVVCRQCQTRFLKYMFLYFAGNPAGLHDTSQQGCRYFG